MRGLREKGAESVYFSVRVVDSGIATMSPLFFLSSFVFCVIRRPDVVVCDGA